jgi:hypothetical protein
VYVSRDETSRVTGDDPGKLAGTRELLSDGKFSANSQIGGGEAQASCACDRQSAGEKREKGRSGERPGSQGEESDEGTTVPFAFLSARRFGRWVSSGFVRSSAGPRGGHRRSLRIAAPEISKVRANPDRTIPE